MFLSDNQRCLCEETRSNFRFFRNESTRIHFAIESNTVDSNSESNNTNATFISSSRVDTTPATTYVQQASTTWQAMSNGRQAILPYHIEQTTSRKLLISLIRTFIGGFLNLRKRNQDKGCVNHCYCLMVSFIVFWLYYYRLRFALLHYATCIGLGYWAIFSNPAVQLFSCKYVTIKLSWVKLS